MNQWLQIIAGFLIVALCQCLTAAARKDPDSVYKWTGRICSGMFWVFVWAIGLIFVGLFLVALAFCLKPFVQFLLKTPAPSWLVLLVGFFIYKAVSELRHVVIKSRDDIVRTVNAKGEL